MPFFVPRPVEARLYDPAEESVAADILAWSGLTANDVKPGEYIVREGNWFSFCDADYFNAAYEPLPADGGAA